jgi:cytoskeletal protein CcmA (bactofilin family)
MSVFGTVKLNSGENLSVRGSGGESGLSILASGTRITGALETDGLLRVEGRVEGNLRAGGQILIAPGGVVEGDITTRQAVVAGEVRGHIVAEESVELKAGCEVHGDITTPCIAVEEGGSVNGQLRMTELPERRSGRENELGFGGEDAGPVAHVA